jgi:hypothetical protein
MPEPDIQKITWSTLLRHHQLQRLALGLLHATVLIPLFSWQVDAGDFDDIIGRMESGSVIKDLLIPRYDEQKRPSMVLRAQSLAIESSKLIRAEKLSLHLISSKDTSKLAPCYLTVDKCHYEVTSGVVRSSSHLQLNSPRFAIHSQGLVSKISRRQTDVLAFLHPPVYGYINPEQSNNTTMNKAAKSLLLAGLVTASAAAENPQPSGDDLAEIGAAQQKKPTNATAKEVVSESYFSLSPRSQEADRKLQDFAKEYDLKIIPLTPAKPTTLTDVNKPVDPVPQLPKFEAAADALGFTCKGGVFFDSITAVMTMLDQVTVRNPAYGMTIKGEVKVFFDTTGKKEKAPGIGKVTRMLGTGGVAFEATDEKGVKNYASGDSVLYKIETEEILLKGSKLIFQQGKESRFESTNADAWLLYNKKTRNFSMSEGWNAQLSLPAK